MNRGPMNHPYHFDERMYLDRRNMQPSDVKGRYNASVMVHKRFLYTKIASCFKFKLPKDWPINFFRDLLFQYGSLAVIYTNEFGWVFQPYGISKIDLYYNPKEIIVYNQFFRTEKIGILGINSQIVHLFDDYYGIDDLVQKYAEKLAQIDKAIDINLMNANVAVTIPANSKKDADSITEAYADATTGKPFVPLNKKLIDENGLKPLINGVKQNYIVNDLLVARRTLMNQFLTDIGISNTNYDKRAQMSDDEVNENNEETEATISVMYTNIKDDFEKVRKVSGLDIRVSLHYNYGEEGENGTSDSMGLLSV